jgi:hypothetical protein
MSDPYIEVCKIVPKLSNADEFDGWLAAYESAMMLAAKKANETTQIKAKYATYCFTVLDSKLLGNLKVNGLIEPDAEWDTLLNSIRRMVIPQANISENAARSRVHDKRQAQGESVLEFSNAFARLVQAIPLATHADGSKIPHNLDAWTATFKAAPSTAQATLPG